MILSTQDRTHAVNVVTPNTEKGSDAWQVSTSVVFAKRLVISVASIQYTGWFYVTGCWVKLEAKTETKHRWF